VFVCDVAFDGGDVFGGRAVEGCVQDGGDAGCFEGGVEEG